MNFTGEWSDRITWTAWGGREAVAMFIVMWADVIANYLFGLE
jgi:hypothetical protein